MPIASSATPVERAPAARFVFSAVRSRITWLRAVEAGLLLVTLGLRLWGLDQNGFGIDYYSAAVRSMTQSWHNLLYNAFDPAGFLSVDKPPVALWIQAASAKLFGFRPASVLLPQVLEGLASVWLLYGLVRRRFGAAAGLLAGLFLAITPVSVAIDRSNNTDSCLVLVLLLSAWAFMRAVERGSLGWLVGALALVGLGFNVKMLAAVVVVPAFVGVYAVGAPVSLRRRALDLGVAGVVLAVVSLSWVVFYDLTPPDRRPFAGSSKTNSMMELSIGHNGVERFVRRNRPPALASTAPGASPTQAAGNEPDAGAASPATPAGWARGRGNFVDRVPAGPLRLADRQLAGQVGWLLPLALMGLVFGASWAGVFSRPTPAQRELLLWAAWALCYAAVYSSAGGIFHAYYLATMAPALAALAGVGVVALWRRYVADGWGVLLLAGALALTAEWEAYIQSSVSGWSGLSYALSSGSRLAVLVLLVAALAPVASRAAHRVAIGALVAAMASLLLTPGAWALSSVLVRGPAMPSASLSRLTPDDSAGAPNGPWGTWRRDDTRKLIRFLQTNSHGERFLVATASTQLAAPIIIETGQPAMAMGGFMGGDPILTPERLAALVAAGEVRFVMVGDAARMRRRFGLEPGGQAVADWVRASGQPVDPDLWRQPGEPPAADAAAPRRGSGRGAARAELYDLKPQMGLVPGAAG